MTKDAREFPLMALDALTDRNSQRINTKQIGGKKCPPESGASSGK